MITDIYVVEITDLKIYDDKFSCNYVISVNGEELGLGYFEYENKFDTIEECETYLQQGGASAIILKNRYL